MKPVIFHAEAQEELDAATERYEEQQAGVGLRFQNEVEKAVALIQQHPQIGALYEDTPFRYWALRRFPFVLYYGETDDALWVFAVAHGSRRPDYWRRRSTR